MPSKSLNRSLHAAKTAKQDEFYTQYVDIQKEVEAYLEFDADTFRGKVVYCNCDDPFESNFFKYFAANVTDVELFLKRNKAARIALKGDEGRYPDGDFRSSECVVFLKEADIVVTNPPFSLFREYVAQLVEHGKHFLIIGSKNAVTYKEIFPLIKANKMWVGAGFSKTMTRSKSRTQTRYLATTVVLWASQSVSLTATTPSSS